MERARPRIGVLALQGDFAAHARALRSCDAEPVEVRTPEPLADVAALILPGGESTTLLRLLRLTSLDRAIPAFHRSGGFLFGTCAGLILLAREVRDPDQESLGLLDVGVQRNAYGRQVESFVGSGTFSRNGGSPAAQEMVFIRAPRILRVGEGVETIGFLGDEPTLVRAGRIWGATFHPELAEPFEIHRRFLAEVAGDR
ncbi:MAG: pyridoxal 5'-phosphate synthase glutaminase subunit PdxT [Candidatus Eisenbacteria bacterium]|nr:pyridoxal 5'-phosphate synthase glutaminase subunit PdxT [Candidatus Latescibacterota bacterium]MBD3300993.1 pyridoxal 5'-phosphate synthase glutaminase subunit PdxT [Candidatus Eisenbacteria bacterium]